MLDKVRTPRRSADQWQAIVDRQSESDLSGAAFCKAEGIPYQSFMNWRKKLAVTTDAGESMPPFVELTTSNPSQADQISHWHIELDLAPGIQLRIAR